MSRSVTLTLLIPLKAESHFGDSSLKFLVYQTPKSVPTITSLKTIGFCKIALTGISGRPPLLISPSLLDHVSPPSFE